MTGYAPSPREQEVLALLMIGHTTAQIAQALSISPATVAHHVEHLMHVYGEPTRLALVCTLWQRRLAAMTADRDECRRALGVLDRRGRS